MTKLFTVTVKYEYVIAVEDGEDPRTVAEDTFGEAKSEMSTHSVMLSTSKNAYFPFGWDDRCYPYRSSGEERTIKQIIEEND